MRIAPDISVGAVVAERLGRARVFERLGIDYCCHGATSLAEACASRSLDLDQVVSEIAESDLEDVDQTSDRIDYAAMTASKLADHIEKTHHAYVHREMPRLAGLIDKVVAAHQSKHPELAGLRETFSALQQELDSHMMKEERVLFPLVRRLESAQEPFPIHCMTVKNPIRVMEHEHDIAGSALERLRVLTDDYQVPVDACATLKALYDGLENFEIDLHRHIHKENNILFPKAAAIEAALG